jgi:hypothetical protein
MCPTRVVLCCHRAAVGETEHEPKKLFFLPKHARELNKIGDEETEETGNLNESQRLPNVSSLVCHSEAVNLNQFL